MLAFSFLFIWDKEEQERSVASEEVNTGDCPLKKIRECLRFGFDLLLLLLIFFLAALPGNSSI